MEEQHKTQRKNRMELSIGTQDKMESMEMKEKDGRRKLMVWVENGHATWSMVASKMSVEGRHLRALKLTQDKTYC